VLAVPSILMIAVLVGEAGAHWRTFIEQRPARALLPILVVIATVQVDGTRPVDVGVEAAGSFGGVEDFTARREAGVGGQTRFVRATLDLVSEPGDPLLMWTSYPWPYLDLDRVSATRYIWKTFLLGEIYLGDSGPEYVLPGTWDNFDADLADADPAVFLVEAVNPVVTDTPFAIAVEERFTTVYSDDISTIGYRDDLAAWIASVPPDADALVPPDPATSVTVSAAGCMRVDGRLSGQLGQPLTIEFGDGGFAGRIEAGFDVGGRYRVDSLPADAPGHTVAGGPASDGSTGTFALIVGERSAALVIDGEIVGAIDLVEDELPVEIVGLGSIDVESLSVSTPLPETGC
jgi:hypothetical protein